MRILAIETSCDETASAVIHGSGGLRSPHFSVISNVILSQVALHASWGGVVPNLARREHEKHITGVIKAALADANAIQEGTSDATTLIEAEKYLSREPDLKKELIQFLRKYRLKEIDAVAVTRGPGLEPALWVGVNAARALASAWKLPLIGVNHMEGHIVAALLANSKQGTGNSKKISENKSIPYSLPTTPLIRFPALALLVSGGHTELVLMKSWGSYNIIGETRDDAAGEAFDKTARLLKLPYPGGPQIAKLAEHGNPHAIEFPRPMKTAKNFDFSFSGLKTSVLYYIRDHPKANKRDVAASIEEAIVDVLTTKTIRAAKEFKVKTVILGGGVAANERLRQELRYQLKAMSSKVNLILPDKKLTTDNAAMIGAAAYIRALKKDFTSPESLTANSGLQLS